MSVLSEDVYARKIICGVYLVWYVFNGVYNVWLLLSFHLQMFKILLNEGSKLEILIQMYVLVVYC